MDILALLLAVIVVTFIIQLFTNVVMITTMVLIKIISRRTIRLGRDIVTATEVERVVTAMIMIVVLIVLVKAIVLNLILVKRMKVVIVLLAALALVLVRTTIICNELNIDTNHSNHNTCCGTTTTATISTNISNHGNNNGSHNRINTHTKIYKNNIRTFLIILISITMVVLEVKIRLLALLVAMLLLQSSINNESK